MTDARAIIRNGLFAALVLVLGVVAGETLAPAPAIASSCDFSVCRVEPQGGPDYCEASSREETCEVISQGVCETSPCDDDGGPGPVE